ncbi:hypothetical protein [Nonomuraea roseoviolacea]|uniref:Uncharacterized protein n=1 Tax=Nonomuraea roseoviolacea subsp. carminata TaxID=160689 RepID=A0ABT1KAG4_9ACTN|nr:hypothetical protein [Nonomuraea roseoviolacea]MCP2350951.1 hypothetical protein [Nonomuraea roseoviolacea subsp. carminata]
MKTSFRALLAVGASAALVLTSGAASWASAAASTAATTGASGGTPAPARPIPAFKAPKIFGTSFQPDPKHDFTKGIHSRHDGILRGQITLIRGAVAEYEPIKWKKDTHTEGYFVGPPEGDVTAYASPVAKDVVFLSAFGCKATMAQMTVSRSTGLGAKRCDRSALLKRHRKQGQPSLITVYKGEIVKVQEIYTP